jgi:putative FmdB family regulatory protein
MPAYDFRCKTCENKFTIRISISERNQVRCPKCNSTSIQQLFTPISVSIKSSKDHSCDLSCGANTKYG